MLIEDKLIRQNTSRQRRNGLLIIYKQILKLLVYMTIEELAKPTYTSHSAIIRLCKKLGFTGFKEFRLELGRDFAINY